MKSGWGIKKLGEVCEINYGTRVRRKDSRSDNYPVYGGGGETFRWETFNRENQCVVSRFAMSPECVRFVSGKFFLNDSGLTVDTASDGLWQDYLDWCLFGKQDIIYALGKGSAQKNLDIREFVNIPIPIPPLSEQKRIVEKIDAAFEKIDKLKANAEKNLANAKKLFQSALDEAMRPKEHWVEKRLPDICINYDSKRIPITKNRRKAGSVPYYGASGIVDYVEGYIFEGEYLLISEDGANLESRTYPIAFSISGRSWVNNHAHILKFADRVTQSYVELYVNSISLKDYITGAAQPKLTQENLNKIPINVPSLSEQREIVKRLDLLAEKIKMLEQNYTQQIADCVEMRQAVLREAFEGRL